MVRRSDKQQAMQTLRDITQHLKHNPAEASAVMAAIQSGVVEDATTPSSGKICIPTSRTKIGCLAAKLYRCVIAEAEPTVTKDLLVRLDKANPKCSQQLFYFFFAESADNPVWTHDLDEFVLGYTERYKVLQQPGRRLGWTVAGEPDWHAYRLIVKTDACAGSTQVLAQHFLGAEAGIVCISVATHLNHHVTKCK